MYDVVSNQVFHNCCLLGAKLVCNFNHFADVFCIVYMVAKIKVRKANRRWLKMVSRSFQIITLHAKGVLELGSLHKKSLRS